MKPDIWQEIKKCDELFFGGDPTQVPTTLAVHKKLKALHPKSFHYKTEKDGRLIGWSIAYPTTVQLMNRFLKGEINERQLFQLTKPGDAGAVHVLSVTVLPKCRGQGHAKALLRETVQAVTNGRKEIPLFYWTLREKGERLAQRVAKSLGVKAYSSILQIKIESL